MVKGINQHRIHLSGGEQIILLVKSWHGSWRKYFKDFKKWSKLHGEAYSRSWVNGGKVLQKYERTHGIRFVVDNDEVFFRKARRVLSALNSHRRE